MVARSIRSSFARSTPPLSLVANKSALRLFARSFQYNSEVRSTSAQALAPIFEAACAYATSESVAGKPVPADMRRMPQQLFSSVCNTVVKQLAEERGEPETMLALADALSDVTCAAYGCLTGGEAGANAPRLTESEGRQLVQR